MALPEIRVLADLALGEAQVSFDIDFPGSVWHTGEVASVKVTFVNTTGCVLRDTRAELLSSASGVLQVIEIEGHISAKRNWGTVNRNEQKEATFFAKAKGTGTAHLALSLKAEVTPRAVNSFETEDFSIHSD